MINRFLALIIFGISIFFSSCGAMESGVDVPGCSICFQDITAKPVVVTSCKHSFHSDCLNRWVVQCEDSGNKVACPLCRKGLSIKRSLWHNVVHSCRCVEDSTIIDVAFVVPTVCAVCYAVYGHILSRTI